MNKLTTDDIDLWLDNNQELMQRLAEIEEREKQIKPIEPIKEAIFPIDEPKKDLSKFQDYYHSEEGNKKEYKRRRTPEARYAKARHDAGRRFSGAKEFTLTLEQYKEIISQNCYYCNTNVSQFTGSGLDRMDNEQGYILGNVVSCCPSCNQRRSKSMSSEEFLRQTILNGYRKD